MDNVLNQTNQTNGTGTVLVEIGETQGVYVEAVISSALALGLIIVVVLQLMIRSKMRHSALMYMRRRVRFDATHFLGSAEDPRQKIILKSVEYLDHKVVKPPQYNRIIPSISTPEGRDAKQDAKVMLDRIRSLLPPTIGCVALLSMRLCVACIQSSLPDDGRVERFLRVHEAVLYGLHIADGSCGDCTEDDLTFMHSFFYGTIVKQFQ